MRVHSLQHVKICLGTRYRVVKPRIRSKHLVVIKQSNGNNTCVVFHKIDYLICCCSGYLVMRQLGQLEMRHSRLSMRWSTSTLGARMTTFSLVETMSVRSRDVLFDHHVAERIASP